MRNNVVDIRGNNNKSSKRANKSHLTNHKKYSKKDNAVAKRKQAQAEFVSANPTLVPRNKNQKRFMDSIENNAITFGMGSAGSGKTYIAGFMAANAFENGLCRKIIVCRPVVEAADEKLGFLPGDLNEKCEPYLKPLFDVFEMYWYSAKGRFKYLIRNEDIEIAPLAYMRGRNFDNTWVICDEAQNMNSDMMKMLLTRVGEDTKLIITGDPKQRDRKSADGFEQAIHRLQGCPNVGFVSFSNQDVERSQIVKDVLNHWGD